MGLTTPNRRFGQPTAIADYIWRRSVAHKSMTTLFPEERKRNGCGILGEEFAYAERGMEGRVKLSETTSLNNPTMARHVDLEKIVCCRLGAYLHLDSHGIKLTKES